MEEREVLFQKVGHLWYVFCEMGEGVVYTSLPLGIDPRCTKLELFEIIEEHLDQMQGQQFHKMNESVA